MDKARRLWANISLPRSIPAIITLYLSKNKTIISKDIERWTSQLGFNRFNYPVWRYLNLLLVYYPEFRNLFYYRIRNKSFILCKMIQPFYKPMNTLYIYATSIGPGFFIQHGFSTIIGGVLGENCHVNQQVTIGYNGDKLATIEDNVLIAAGAMIIGGVRIGKNSIIGAGAVVTKNVPENCTVVGNPALIIKKNGVKVREYLSSADPM